MKLQIIKLEQCSKHSRDNKHMKLSHRLHSRIWNHSDIPGKSLPTPQSNLHDNRKSNWVDTKHSTRVHTQKVPLHDTFSLFCWLYPCQESARTRVRTTQQCNCILQARVIRLIPSRKKQWNCSLLMLRGQITWYRLGLLYETRRSKHEGEQWDLLIFRHWLLFLFRQVMMCFTCENLAGCASVDVEMKAEDASRLKDECRE